MRSAPKRETSIRYNWASSRVRATIIEKYNKNICVVLSHY
jgi:hypothetical protein